MIIPLSEILPRDRECVGGKAFSLSRMMKSGLRVPETVCIPVQAYQMFVDATGIRERIMRELTRKKFSDMRWEEIWDASLRIRHLFDTKPVPEPLLSTLQTRLEHIFKDRPVAVRSSAPGEDSAKTSFAGLHESHVNISGADNIVRFVKRVWASLWSDAAILYRKELNLDFSQSAMAVVIMALVSGRASGVAFGQSPTDPAKGVVEAVHGLNQGLVDGSVEPDQWLLDRSRGEIVAHTPARRTRYLVPADSGYRLAPIPETLASTPPLSHEDVCRAFHLAMVAEKVFGTPQDVEFTFSGQKAYLLQSRPITTLLANSPDEKRRWYLSLKRSLENLQVLRCRIENELIPRMVHDAETLASQNIKAMPDDALADEIRKRRELERYWTGVYWEEFIPFAHGMRLFGKVYNDALAPDSPYEFVSLLSGSGLEGVLRNQMLDDLARSVRNHPEIRMALSQNTISDLEQGFQEKLRKFLDRFGNIIALASGQTPSGDIPDGLINLVLELADHPGHSLSTPGKDVESLEIAFLNAFSGDDRQKARDLLDLARASYRLRDDDNIHLARIEAHVTEAVLEALFRIGEREKDTGSHSEQTARLKAAVEMFGRQNLTAETSSKSFPQSQADKFHRVQARQLVGQPAGPGLARGKARVLRNPQELMSFKHGEILVCDAIDPKMTFIVPLAAGIVERRGGMLIHGAIIAREYGLPCITGVADATVLIKSGEMLTVDGYLGIVTLGNPTLPE